MIDWYPYSNEQKLEFEYGRTRILFEYDLLANPPKGIEDFNQLIEVSTKSNSLYLLNETYKMMGDKFDEMSMNTDLDTTLFDRLYAEYTE